MHDPRLRIAATILLSTAAFMSTEGAVLAFLWWLLFTPRLKAIPHPRMLLGVLLMISITALVSEYTGGLGISYLVRMIPIILIAAWAYSDRQESELLDVSVWLLGRRIGFDIGLTAEMGLQSLQLISHDLEKIKQAMTIKGMPVSVASIIPLSMNLVVNQLRRTEEASKLLTVRGYSAGGEITPNFVTTKADVSLTFIALLTFSTSFWLF